MLDLRRWKEKNPECLRVHKKLITEQLERVHLAVLALAAGGFLEGKLRRMIRHYC
jgi:hypothetical protein